MEIINAYLIKALAILIVITVMGFSKAYTSYKLGDIAIKNMGKVSLNPKKHFEILGFIIFIFFGYGWTAPLDTSSLYYKNRKKGNILVNTIPFLVAIIFAFLSYFIAKILTLFNLGIVLNISVFFSILGAYFINFLVFNIFPIYPLFGQKLFQAILPSNKAIKLSQYEKMLQIVVVFLLISGILQKFLQYISLFILTMISLPVNIIFGAI